MNKQEIAEWLMINLLEMKKSGDGLGWWNGNPKFECIGDEVIDDVIYTPDGFFAVLDGINKRLAGEGVHSIELELAWYTFFRDMDMEAFYNAVYEAMKK